MGSILSSGLRPRHAARSADRPFPSLDRRSHRTRPRDEIPAEAAIWPYAPHTMQGVPQIVAFGGGGFSMEAGNPLMDAYVLGLVERERPRVCFLPSASGDADHYIVRFFRHFPADRCEPSHVSLIRRERGIRGDLREHLLAQDVSYVGGGSVISLLGVWQAHRVGAVLREAWERGIV